MALNPVKSFAEKLTDIVRCAVCKELPEPTIVYQCPLGQITCEKCNIDLFANANLNQMVPKCPICDGVVIWDKLARNMLVVNVINELPRNCEWCHNNFPICLHENHKKNLCPERPTNCRYRVIGCSWIGPYSQTEQHESKCQCLNDRSDVLISNIQALNGGDIQRNKKRRTEMIYKNLEATAECVSKHDIEVGAPGDQSLLKYGTRIHFPSAYFIGFGLEWKFSIRFQQDHGNRSFKYKLVLYSQPDVPLKLHYYLKPSQIEKLEIEPKIYTKTFNYLKQTSSYKKLNIAKGLETDKLLAKLTAEFSLYLFLNGDPYGGGS